MFFYDSRNRLIAMEDGSQFLQYTYDSNGIRQSKSIDGDAFSYLVDPLQDYAQVIGVIDSFGNTVASYTYGLDRVSETIGENISYYHFDGLGSTRKLSNSNGMVTDTYTYKAFGDVEHRIGSTANEYLFTGEQYDVNLGFYYLRARYYDSSNSKFQTMDTWLGRIYEPNSLHKYTYVLQNPVNGTDPSGHATLTSQSFASSISTSLQTGFHNTYRVTLVRKTNCIVIEQIAEQAVTYGVYILLDGAGSYTGKSVDIDKRIKQHGKDFGKNIKQTLGKFTTNVQKKNLRVIEQFMIDFMKDNQKRLGLGKPTNRINAVADKPKSKNSKRMRKLLNKLKIC